MTVETVVGGKGVAGSGAGRSPLGAAAWWVLSRCTGAGKGGGAVDSRGPGLARSDDGT